METLEMPMRKNAFLEILQKSVFSTFEQTGNRSNPIFSKSWSSSYQPFWTSNAFFSPRREKVSSIPTLPISVSLKPAGVLLPETARRLLITALLEKNENSTRIPTTESLRHDESRTTREETMIRTGIAATCNKYCRYSKPLDYIRNFSNQEASFMYKNYTSSWCPWSNALNSALWLTSWKNMKKFEKYFGVAEPKQCRNPVYDDRILLDLVSGSCYIPHPNKRMTGGGGDAHFICDNRAVGVADGVAHPGMPSDHGKYAKELMHYASSAAFREPNMWSIDAMKVLERAYYYTEAPGSSTACIVARTDRGCIHAVNIGDGGFIIIRDSRIIFSSSIQQHQFNIPYQLKADDAGDPLDSVAQFVFPVEPGDVIITSTDGLFDNLYMEEIVTIVVYALRGRLGPKATAQQLATLAHQRAQNSSRESPFSIIARAAGYQFYGGKQDDITIVISYVTHR